MKTPRLILATLLTFAAFITALHADVTGRTEDSSLAGTEKILSDSSGSNTFFTVNTLFGATRTLVSPVISTGLAASGSASNNFSGSTGAFQTSSGLNTFNGSGHSFAAALYPGTNDGAALGDATHNFSDLFLASGALINWANSNVLLTHTSGILTLGTGELRITTAGTNAASVPTLGSTSTLTNKTLTSPVISTGLTASGSAANTFAGSTGTFITSTGANTFKGSAHNFDAVLQPTTDDAAALGTTSLGFSDLFLATGGTVHFGNTNWVATHTSGILTVGTGDLRVTTAGTNTASVVTVGGTQTLTSKTLTSPTMTTPTLGAAVATSIEGLTSGLIFEGATADAYEGTDTIVDVTADRTYTRPNASGTYMLAQTSTTTALTADNQAVTPGSNTVLQLTSDDATDTNRTFTLSATGAITGQIYVLIGPATNACEIADTGIQKLSATWSPAATDTLTLLFDGTNFVEMARSNN